MKSKQVMFFLLLDDIEQAFRGVEEILDVQYYKTGLFDTKAIPSYYSIFDVPNIGYTSYGDWNRIDNYIIMKKTTVLKERSVVQRNGDLRFAVDQMNNPKSIELKLGGIYKDKSNVIVGGRVATISEDIDSRKLYNEYVSRIKKVCKKIGAFYVGNEAEKKLELGWRLVTNESSSKEFDLSFD